jgi:hypothetical protein
MKPWHWIALLSIAAASLVLELMYLRGHGGHWWNAIPGFYMIWGFLSCVVIIVVSKAIGKLILFRREDYYDA